MAEFIGGDTSYIKPGEVIAFSNKSESPVEVGTGIIFKKDGVYKVTVKGNKILVEKDNLRKDNK